MLSGVETRCMVKIIDITIMIMCYVTNMKIDVKEGTVLSYPDGLRVDETDLYILFEIGFTPFCKKQ